MGTYQHSLSVVIIAKNAADVIDACLESAKFADEIILLDSGSTDDTCEKAKTHGAKVFVDTNWEGFGRQRQKAQALASCDFVLMVDADEQITEALRSEIQLIMTSKIQDNVVYAIPRSNLFLGRFMKHSGWYPDYVIRLYQRTLYSYNNDLVHESLDTQGAHIQHLKAPFKHLTCRDLIQFQHKQLQYAQAWADERVLKGKKCSYVSIWTHSMSAFIKVYLFKLGFLDGKQGLLLACVNANYTFNKYTHLWVNQLKDNKK